jgi:hypothetical protein
MHIRESVMVDKGLDIPVVKSLGDDARCSSVF